MFKQNVLLFVVSLSLIACGKIDDKELAVTESQLQQVAPEKVGVDGTKLKNSFDFDLTDKKLSPDVVVNPDSVKPISLRELDHLARTQRNRSLDGQKFKVQFLQQNNSTDLFPKTEVIIIIFDDGTVIIICRGSGC